MAAQKKNGDESLQENEDDECLEEKEDVGKSADDSNDVEEGYDESEEETEEDEDAALKQIAERSSAKVNIKLPIPSGLPFAVAYEGGDFYFVRKCYDVYYMLVVKLLKEGKKCITLTGTPAKLLGRILTLLSILYAYFFDHFRSEHQGQGWIIVALTYKKAGTVKKLAIFQEGQDTIRVEACPQLLSTIALELKGVSQQNLAGLKNYNRKKKVLYLCDGPPHVSYPQAVVFTSPNDRWLGNVRKDRCTYWMPPWKLKELQLAAAELDYPVNDEELKERFWNLGGVARHCISLDPEAIPEAMEELKECITSINNRGDLENLLLGRQNNDTRHRFLHYQPISTGRRKDTKLLGLLETVKEKPERAAIVFLHPQAKGFKQQNIIVSGGSPKSLEAIGGIGPLTMKTLALYGVTTVEELKNAINDFRDGKIVMQDSHNVSKHKADWMRALRCWESHMDSLSDSSEEGESKMSKKSKEGNDGRSRKTRRDDD
ncbi:hypothetical protein PHYSODRAFT_473347 [Phytophthora sojae]|uniref:Uncharacterized protein n=1 Tax=Phytophthora sojae (strain P6497) TaxID=1094619 RepID=G4YIZ3_PHYSP|nr:hypothetical protein PHYSODRAFT_473347 [Phytophthora sojae]EGZ28815.1 hypothetical protein PHYSODRAFT_473347 [Phytophthora sojae]|eukprot:XP_009516090.1 hypothetical protein PHYSODRAFT_473347 [Phytophthora sojae]